MELFIFGLNEPEKICGSQEDPDDVCEWKGVKCNADKEVENFRWLMKRQEGTGTLSLAFLPYTMKKALSVYKSYLGRTGTARYDAQKTREPSLGMYQAEA